MGSKQQAAASSAFAKRMKELGIRRRTAKCPICYSTVGIPMDNHIRSCKGPKRKGTKNNKAT